MVSKELIKKRAHQGSAFSFLPGCRRVMPSSDLPEEPLSLHARLVRRYGAMRPDGDPARPSPASADAVLDEVHLSAYRRDFEAEAAQLVIPNVTVTRFSLSLRQPFVC